MRMVRVRLEDGTVISVRHPRVPPPQPIEPERRDELARDWLVSLSQAPTSERIEALAPLVGRFPPRSPLGRVASALVASNQLPTTENVITTYLHRQAARRRHQVPVDQIPDSTRQQVLQLIDRHQAERGQGPAWSWLGRQVGLDRQAMAALLRELKKTGAITFTHTPGSLRRVAPGEPRLRPPPSGD